MKPVQKRRPIIWISLEPHFVNVSPFRHHWSPFVTILSPPLLLFYSKFIWIFIFWHRVSLVSGVVPARTQNHRYQIMWQIVWHCNYSNYRIGIESSEISVDESLFQTVRFLDFWSIFLTGTKIWTEFLGWIWPFTNLDCRHTKMSRFESRSQTFRRTE